MSETARRNRAVVAAAFERWGRGEGSFFDLLADDAVWTIVGEGWPAGVYRGRDRYVAAAVSPLFDRLAEATVPRDVRLLADGDEVVVRWAQRTPLRDGGVYRNEYAWFLVLQDARIVRVTAFLDLAAYARAVRPAGIGERHGA